MIAKRADFYNKNRKNVAQYQAILFDFCACVWYNSTTCNENIYPYAQIRVGMEDKWTTQ